MRKISDIKRGLANRSVYPSEVKRCLSTFLYSLDFELAIPVESNLFEREVQDFDNRLERIIYSLPEEDQITQVLDVLDEAELFLSRMKNREEGD
mgnify:CR=1 FL=1